MSAVHSTQVAYVDSSCLVAIAFDEPSGRDLASRLESFEQVFSANLLEAELRAAALREGVEGVERLFSWVTWIVPDRPLNAEIGRVLEAGYGRGADVWHLACAIYLMEDPKGLPFLTLDARQGELARALGFFTPA